MISRPLTTVSGLPYVIKQLSPHSLLDFLFFLAAGRSGRTFQYAGGTYHETEPSHLPRHCHRTDHPTTPTGIDYDRFGRLIDWQIQQGDQRPGHLRHHGESSTLTDAEHRRAIAFACERVNGRVPVIAGTGSNETDYAVELTKSACADRGRRGPGGHALLQQDRSGAW